jgi:hypothetical protein
MRRPKKAKGLVTPAGWTIIEAERHAAGQHVRDRRVRRKRPLLWALRIFIALLVLASLTPYLRDEDLSAPFARFINFRPATPVNPGDHNGLLRK